MGPLTVSVVTTHQGPVRHTWMSEIRLGCWWFMIVAISTGGHIGALKPQWTMDGMHFKCEPCCLGKIIIRPHMFCGSFYLLSCGRFQSQQAAAFSPKKHCIITMTSYCNAAFRVSTTETLPIESQLGSFVVVDADLSQREVRVVDGSNKHGTFTQETSVCVPCETESNHWFKLVT